MRTRWWCLLLGIFLAGCKPPPSVDFLSLDTPGLPAKLGITEHDWQALQKLSSEEKGFVAFRVAKEESGSVEIEYAQPGDKLHDQGGPSYSYEKRDGVWKKEDNVIGYWAAPVVIDTRKRPEPSASPVR